MSWALDHLVVAAATLEDGAAWCEATFGVAPDPGGQHADMGTHNRLLNISGPDFERAYLEIIAIDPKAPAPSRPRWFEMDDPVPSPPRLAHWAARSRVMDMHRWGLMALGIDPGPTRAMQRGEWRWRLTVRDDGRMLARGAVPSLIDWPGPHPADALPDRGVRLRALRLAGLPEPALRVLQLRSSMVTDTAGAPPIEALFDTPRGPVRLTSAETRQETP